MFRSTLRVIYFSLQDVSGIIVVDKDDLHAVCPDSFQNFMIGGIKIRDQDVDRVPGGAAHQRFLLKFAVIGDQDVFVRIGKDPADHRR